MIDINDKEIRNKLTGYCEQYGLNVDEDQLDLLLQHLDLVLEKNKVLNLTRVTDLDEALVLHILDSLLLSGLDLEYQGKYLDIGTGAGYPGIPFGIYTHMEGVLLDSVGKKIKADNEFLQEMKLDSQIHGVHDRVEEFAKQHRGEFNIVMARAVAQSNVILEYASPLQSQNGTLLIAKANITSEEYSNALKTAHIVGYENVSRETFELPDNLGHREVLVFKKVRNSKVKLPRKNGLAKQHPLGCE